MWPVAVHPPSKSAHAPYPTSQLRPGTPASPGRHHLGLLPSGPDPVRGCPPRGTQPSTPLSRAASHRHSPQGGIQPRYGGLRVQGTASSPPSTAREYDSAGQVKRQVKIGMNPALNMRAGEAGPPSLLSTMLEGGGPQPAMFHFTTRSILRRQYGHGRDENARAVHARACRALHRQGIDPL